MQSLEDLKTSRLKQLAERDIFPEGEDARKRPYADFRWTCFKNFEVRDV